MGEMGKWSQTFGSMSAVGLQKIFSTAELPLVTTGIQHRHVVWERCCIISPPFSDLIHIKKKGIYDIKHFVLVLNTFVLGLFIHGIPFYLLM